MKRRFVIGAAPLDQEQERRLREYLGKIGPWWHWIGNMWLVTTDSEEPTVVKIRDYIQELDPNVRVVVFEFPEDINWAASGNKNAKGKMLADWLKTTWGPD